MARSLCSQSSLRAIKKQAEKLAEMLDANGLVLFSGGCNDFAVIIHRETGILLGQESTSVWMGGDLNTDEKDGVEYCPSISPTAGDFSSANRPVSHE
ncbi:MAG: hypothetical protein M0Q93_00135 [Terrimicrobiaceae bacterium]|nr:hypothetical protein [Terrimicrobiaceae bacterium]